MPPTPVSLWHLAQFSSYRLRPVASGSDGAAGDGLVLAVFCAELAVLAVFVVVVGAEQPAANSELNKPMIAKTERNIFTSLVV
jgi:hypothetical protein